MELQIRHDAADEAVFAAGETKRSELVCDAKWREN
jgi:hypothetical protein